MTLKDLIGRPMTEGPFRLPKRSFTNREFFDLREARHPYIHITPTHF